MQWPDHFPLGCPPETATPSTHTYFRLTNKATPKERDFRSHFSRDPENMWSNPCQACGLSVYTNVEDVDRLKKRVPGCATKWVAKGTLSERDGRVLHTPSQGDSHHSWWVPTGIEPWHQFESFLRPDGTSL